MLSFLIIFYCEQKNYVTYLCRMNMYSNELLLDCAPLIHCYLSIILMKAYNLMSSLLLEFNVYTSSLTSHESCNWSYGLNHLLYAEHSLNNLSSPDSHFSCPPNIFTSKFHRNYKHTVFRTKLSTFNSWTYSILLILSWVKLFFPSFQFTSSLNWS